MRIRPPADRLLACAVCSLLALATWAALQRVLPLPSAAGLVDLRHDRTKHDFSLVLNVRDAGFYGHARLTWFRHGNGARETVAFGYYADAPGQLVEVFDTQGKVVDEQSVPVVTGQEARLALVFWLDEADYRATLARVDAWRGTGRYQLFRRDCVSFVDDILQPLGLKAPSRLLFPTPRQFVVAVMEANAQRVRE